MLSTPPARDGDPRAATADASQARLRDVADAVLLVCVADTWLGLDTRAVKEVAAVETPSPLPFAPPHVVGVIVHGEHVVPLVDLAKLCSLPARADENADRSFGRTLILSSGGMCAGIIADRAAGVVEVAPGALEPLTLLKGQRIASFLAGEMDTPWGRCGVLDINALFEAARVPDSR